jgi:tRNA threonylcarbamoyladenosine biosynthesis protein TsaB
MKILGIDTSTAATAVALRLAGGTLLEARDDPPANARPGHAAQLLPLALALLERATLRWGELDAVAVGLGPGTFTGLRIGVASAHALSTSLRIETLGVGSLPALALPALRARATTRSAGGVLAALDARRGEIFLGGYALDERAAGSEDGSPPEPAQLLAPRALRAAEVGAAIGELLRELEQPPDAWTAVGDGALLVAEQLLAAGVEVEPSRSPLHLLRAAAVCELALTADVLQGVDAQPRYGRRPDAELTLEAAGR